MPCRCDGYDNCPDVNEALRKEADKATRAACDMRTVLRNNGLVPLLCGETIDWIVKHDEADAKRIAEEQRSGERERAKQAALDKLTMDERRMLGL